MARYFVESIKSGIGNMGFDGPVVSEVKFSDGEKEFFLCLVEVEGMPNYYLTDESTFDVHMGKEEWDEDLEPIDCAESYTEILENEDNELLPLYKFLAYVVRSDWNVFDLYKNKAIRKFIDEMDIPEIDFDED